MHMDCFTHRNIEMSFKYGIKIYQNIIFHLTNPTIFLESSAAEIILFASEPCYFLENLNPGKT
jgi:hypothetical protein